MCAREAFPASWAAAQNGLGNLFRERIMGVQRANLEQAVATPMKPPYTSTPAMISLKHGQIPSEGLAMCTVCVLLEKNEPIWSEPLRAVRQL